MSREGERDVPPQDGLATRLIQLGRSHRRGDDPHGALSTPIYQTATFEQSHADRFDRYDYARSQNPTREVLERMLADLDGAERSFAYTSGVAALAAVFRMVPARGNIVTIRDLYAGTLRLLERIVRPQGIELRLAGGLSPDAIASLIDDRTAMVLVESPTNPLLRVVDLRAVAAVTSATGVPLVVDGTMMTPVLQRPLALGADAVVHSATKFLGGHSDLTGGVVSSSHAAIIDHLAVQQNAEGTAIAPFDAWLLVRGLKTLGLRVERQQASARRVAAWLRAHPGVTRVRFLDAGDADGAAHATQSEGPGAVLAFETGDARRSCRVAESARLFTIAVSFGSVHSQISVPAAMSHSSLPDSIEGPGVPGDLVRVSVGLEDPEDLIRDLSAAFDTSGA